MDDKTFIDYITTKLNLDDSLDDQTSSLKIDQAIEENLIVIREILSDNTPTVVSTVLNYIETKIENLIKSEEGEVEILDCESFLIRLGRDLDLYHERPNHLDETFSEITKIVQEIETNIPNQSWNESINVLLDENGNPFTHDKVTNKIYEWLETRSFDNSYPSSEKKSVRFDLDLNQIRDITPRRKLRSGRQLFSEDNYNKRNFKQHATSLVDSSININEHATPPRGDLSINKKKNIEQQETINACENLDSILFTSFNDDTIGYADMGCSPITYKPIVTRSVSTETVLPSTKSIGTSPIKVLTQSHDQNYDRLIKQKIRYLTPMINRMIFTKTKKYFKFFVNKHGLMKISGAKNFRSLGTNTTPIANNPRKRRLKKNVEANERPRNKKLSHTHKGVKSTQPTLSQMFRQTVKDVLKERAVSPTDVSLSLIRDYRDPNIDECTLLSGFPEVGCQIKNEPPDYISHSPVKIPDSLHLMENLDISEGRKPRRKLYSKLDFPVSDLNENSSPIKRNNMKQSNIFGMPLTPKIIVLKPNEQIINNIEIINTIPQNKLENMFEKRGLCDQLARVLTTPIKYTKDVTYVFNSLTGDYEAMDFTTDDSLDIPLKGNTNEFVTSSQKSENRNGRAYFYSNLSPICRVLS